MIIKLVGDDLLQRNLCCRKYQNIFEEMREFIILSTSENIFELSPKSFSWCPASIDR